MTKQMNLPELGEGVLEGELTKWRVQVGGKLERDKTICEVMTDKATVEIPSHVEGTVTALIAQEGSVIKVGQHILDFEPGSSTSKGTSSTTPATKQPTPPVSTPNAMTTARPSVQVSPASTGGLSPASTTSSLWVRSSPSVRKKAKELGINLNHVQATGDHGRVLMSDLLGHQSTPLRNSNEVATTKPKVESWDPSKEKRTPIRGMRKAIAKAMTLSKFTAPHFTYVDELDVTKLVRLRAYAKDLGVKKGIKVTFLPFYVKALSAAIREFPSVNCSFDESTQEIVSKEYIHIGIATATPEGLIVPNIKNADRLSIFQLAQQINEKTTAAVQGKSKLEDLKNGTFTITNIGSIGGLFATPIINYPEVGILGVYRIIKRPVIVGKKIVGRDMTYISLTFDHRMVDGATAAQFGNRLIEYLQTPELLLLSEDL